jgi:NAD(P)-dependent dehydrogenase (short-subunit alcohol dehydrogenase family)
MSQVALVTGCSSGIGLSTAVRLAEEGFQVVATMRDTNKQNALLERAKAQGVTLEVAALDVTSDASVQNAIQGVLERYRQIDVLVNNAGAGQFGTLEQVSVEDAKRTMDVNFFGVWRVTAAVLPTMRAAQSGRVISVSSIGGMIGQPFNDAYCAAKFALEGVMESLAPVVRPHGIWVSLIEPGPVNTEFVQNVGGRALMGATQSDPYFAQMSAYLRNTQAAFANANIGQTGDDIAATILEVATADAPHFRYQTSELMKTRVAGKFADLEGDAQIAAMAASLK